MDKLTKDTVSWLMGNPEVYDEALYIVSSEDSPVRMKKQLYELVKENSGPFKKDPFYLKRLDWDSILEVLLDEFA